MQQLNAALLELDAMNTEKRTTSYKLIDTIKFVKDLEKGISSGENLDEIVSAKIKQEYRREKELN